MKVIKVMSACLAVGLINIFTLGYKKPTAELAIMEMESTIEHLDPLGLNELNLKLDSINTNLDILEYESNSMYTISPTN